MRVRHVLICAVTTTLSVLAAAGIAQQADPLAAEPEAAAGEALEQVVVNGYVGSEQGALRRKRRASQVVDAIVADDIGKLPDINTAEALQRVPGVQLSTDLGEGATVAIRGLSQVETLLNGRETFSAAGTRTLNFEFLPAELLSSIDIYKTQTADLIEGGMGGTIDVRTRRPFDFPGLTADASALANYGDLARDVKPQLFALLSDRWETSAGELGTLLAASFQERALREDTVSAGAPGCYATVSSGECGGIVGPEGFYNPQYTAQRSRLGLNTALQWRPSESLEMTLDATFERFRTGQMDFGTYALPNTNVSPNSVSLYPGTDILESGTYLDQPLHTLSIDRLQIDSDSQVAIGGRWSSGRLSVGADVSHLDSDERLDYRELDLQTTLPTFSASTSSVPITQGYGGVNLGAIGNYDFAGLTESVNLWSAQESALQLDVKYRIDGGPITGLEAGARYADLSDGVTPTRYFNSLADGPASANAGLIESYPLGTPFAGAPRSSIGGYLAVNPSALRNFNQLIASLGLQQYPAVQTQGIYSIAEQDSAAYAKLNFAADTRLKLDGNVGVRMTHTEDSLAGTETISGARNEYQPIALHNSYSNALPSLNLRLHLTDDLTARFAAYRSVTRPEFSGLNPGLTLVPANLSGSQGNPGLAPFTAGNLDATLEWYFGKLGSLFGDAFYKEVRGFPFTQGTEQSIGGQTYTISQPVNSGVGKIEGVEAGYRQLYDRLPSPLEGLGAQLNLTYVQSSAPTSIAGYDAALPNLSKWSLNAIGIYERGRWSARIAYSWRSQFLESIVATQGVGIVAIDSAPFGQLAAALNYRVGAHCVLTIEGTNLTQPRRESFYGSMLSPSATFIDDRQFLVGVRYRSE